MSFHVKIAALGLFAALLAAQTPPADPAAQAPEREPGLYATMTTTMGVIQLRLFEKEAPITVKNFIDLQRGRKAWRDQKTGAMVRRPFYTGLIFHRVIAGFMIQSGDPAGTGMGNPGFTIKDEIVPTLKFSKPGILAMANIGEPNTGATQFFITVAPTPHLNGQHTIFGEVVGGMDVVNKIANVKTNADDRPLTPVRITGLTFERVGPAPANDPLGPPRPAKKAAPAKK
ncbi:MAG TPA: peptidylprolyl isomerase [Bryobacteraceae bacterium]|nr:peptidylprolyl isomerase [Bryobacteraceae bacterium]HOQ47188.1 peptidylprolyl isomerase [Bryobacteraceae bacterium]HPQ16179.1 peptidylprolyl isomerase [Bryobacteraceae bacterium]HPU74066.1 peptidylprolyl isomerase [Bryobacteraceae bacterium]